MVVRQRTRFLVEHDGNDEVGLPSNVSSPPIPFLCHCQEADHYVGNDPYGKDHMRANILVDIDFGNGTVRALLHPRLAT